MNLHKRKKNAAAQLVAGYRSFFLQFYNMFFELKLGFGGQVQSDVSLFQWRQCFILLFCLIVSERAL